MLNHLIIKSIDLAFTIAEVGLWLLCIRYALYQADLRIDLLHLKAKILAFDRRLAWYRGPQIVHQLRARQLLA